MNTLEISNNINCMETVTSNEIPILNGRNKMTPNLIKMIQEDERLKKIINYAVIMSNAHNRNINASK